MTIKESIEKFAVEFFGYNLRHAILPPAGCRFAVMKLHAPKLPRIGKNERPFMLIQHQVIVLLRMKPRRFDAQLSSHPEMDPDPTPNAFASPDYFGVAAGKLEQHLFPPGE